MLSAILAFSYLFFAPLEENKGYEEVIIPTNPIPYAARLNGTALVEHSPVRMEDLLFSTEMVMDRWRVIRTVNFDDSQFSPVDYNSRVVSRSLGRGVRMYTFPANILQMSQPHTGFYPSSLCGYLYKMLCGTNYTSNPNYTQTSPGYSYALNAGGDGTQADMTSSLASVIPSTLVPLRDWSLTPAGIFVRQYLAPALSFGQEGYSSLTSGVTGLSYKLEDLSAICQYAQAIEFFSFSCRRGSPYGLSLSNILETTVSQHYDKSYSTFNGWVTTSEPPTAQTTLMDEAVPYFYASCTAASWQEWVWEGGDHPVNKGDGESRNYYLTDRSTAPSAYSTFPLFPEWVYDKVNYMKAYGLFSVSRSYQDYKYTPDYYAFENANTNAYAVLPLDVTFSGIRRTVSDEGATTNSIAWYGCNFNMGIAAEAIAQMDMVGIVPSWTCPEMPPAPAPDGEPDPSDDPIRIRYYSLTITLVDVFGVIGVNFKSKLPSASSGGEQ